MISLESTDPEEVRDWPMPEHPVLHMRQPGDSVTIVFEPAPSPEAYPAELLPPFRMRAIKKMDVYDRPNGKIIKQATIGGQLDIHEISGKWWRVTKAPQPEMWVRAAYLSE